MIIVISGPGGVGKGTVVARLVERDPNLWLNRSWTTREPRPGEAPDAYTFVDRAAFEAHSAAGGFLEHAEFIGNLYGSPFPDQIGDADVVLEIDVQGAEQVVDREPDALLIFVVAPSADVQEARLRGRGDAEEKVLQRVEHAANEVAAGERLGATFVVNDDLESTVDEILAIIAASRGR